MSTEIVNDPPKNCPGPESENRGNSDACQGCPSQEYCKSTPKVDPDLPIIKERLSTIDKKILVLSGKGGVGKSTISSQLSFYLSSFEENEVGLLDIDICGPSIPRIMGLEGREILSRSNLGWEPVYLDDNLAVMSIGFLLGNSDDAIIWRGPKKNGAIKQFLKDVHWSSLDYLVVDTPPGTSDEHLSIVTYLKDSKIDGAVIVTTPQEVSLSDVRKEINFCKKLKIPIIGVIENMSGFVCPKCKNGTQIFYPTTGGASKMCEEMEVPFLGSIPLDPFIAKNCDEGKSFIEQCPDSLASKSYLEIFEKVVDFIKKEEESE